MKGSAEKIEKIKKIAFKMFLETGYEATTVRMICKEAGIEPPTLYYFFESKKGLFLALRKDMEQVYLDLLNKMFTEEAKDPEAILKRYFKFCIRYALKYEQETRFFLRYRLFKPAELVQEINEYIKSSEKELRKDYFSFIEQMVEAKWLTCSAEQAFFNFSTYINSNVFSVIFSEWKPDDEEIEAAWDIFMNSQLLRQERMELSGGRSE